MKLERGATSALAHAKTEWGKHLMARFVGFALGVMALFLAALALVAAATGHGAPAFGAAAIAALDFALATAVWSFARGRLKASRDALDAGWASAASQIAQKRGGRITARELAVAMQTTEPTPTPSCRSCRSAARVWRLTTTRSSTTASRATARPLRPKTARSGRRR